jgi:hypothetical protein
MLARNIDTFGFLVPCLIDEENRLLTGAARVMAAERLGMKEIPVVRVKHLSDVEKRAFVIADTKLAELGSWEPNILRSELQFLTISTSILTFRSLALKPPRSISFLRAPPTAPAMTSARVANVANASHQASRICRSQR